MGAVSAFGVVTGVARITQRRPKLAALEKMHRGVLKSWVAALKSTFPDRSTGAAMKDAKRYVRQVFEDPAFEDGVERRAAGMAMA